MTGVGIHGGAASGQRPTARIHGGPDATISTGAAASESSSFSELQSMEEEDIAPESGEGEDSGGCGVRLGFRVVGIFVGTEEPRGGSQRNNGDGRPFSGDGQPPVVGPLCQ